MSKHGAQDRADAAMMSSGAWMSAYLRPWEVLGDWNAFWGKQWLAWLRSLATAPSPWVPALASNRPNELQHIDPFLPWLPRLDAVITPLAGEHDAVRLLVRAAIPHVGGGRLVDFLTLDATISRGETARVIDLPSESLPILPEPKPAGAVMPAEPARNTRAKAGRRGDARARTVEKSPVRVVDSAKGGTARRSKAVAERAKTGGPSGS